MVLLLQEIELMSPFKKESDMNKENLLKQLAEAGYNIGYGAKKHFATYDIVEKVPNLVNFLLLVIGILALIIDALSTKLISAIMIIFGISGLYISFYNDKQEDYNKAGKYLTTLFDEVKTLYYKVKAPDYVLQDDEQDALSNIQSRAHKRAISKQILFSDWYAHYKFFWQHQIDWIEEQKHFSFWKDKMPLPFIVILFFAIIGLLGYYYEQDILSFIHSLKKT